MRGRHLSLISLKHQKYDNIILGFPVWASRPAPPLCTFLDEHKEQIERKEDICIACQSGNGAEKAFERIKKQIGIDGFEAELILIDPKTRVNEDNDRKIEAFCEKLI